MTREEALIISQYILDGNGLDGRVIPLSDGREYAVKICSPAEWFCFSFQDWNSFCKKHRQRRYTKRWRGRKAYAQEGSIT